MEQTDHTGHRDRLRQRYRREGLDGFAPHEMLELLLTYAIPRVDVNPIAHGLMDRFGTLDRVLEASPEELAQTPGVGASAATLISMLLPLLRAYQAQKLLPRKLLNTYEELAAYCRTLFLGAGTEQFYLLCLDAKLKLLSVRLLSSGTPSEVSVSPRLIVQELVRQNAVGAVITHNHPSGSAQPSQEDVALTRDIQSLLKGMDVRLYDHVIIAGDGDYSFFRNGWLSDPAEELSLAADRPQRALPPRRNKR